LSSREQPAEELPRRRLVPAALHEDIQHIPVLIDGPPEIVLRAIDGDEDLVQVPLVTGLWPTAPQRIGVVLAELAAPLAHRLVGEDDPALGEQFLHVAIAEREAEVQPHRVRDDRRREPVAFVAGRGGVLLRASSIAHPPAREASYLP
jgi:hypothetical protein